MRTQTNNQLYYSHTRHELAHLVLPAKYNKVLEIGCGAGAFATNYLPDCQRWGMDPHKEATELAKTYCNHIIQGKYRDAESLLPNNYFDFAVCNDVIEHIPDPEAFLVDIQKKMTTGAYLTGSIPNVRFYRTLFAMLVLKDWRYSDEGILDRTHRFFFTKKSLIRTLANSGYHIELIKGIRAEQSGRHIYGTIKHLLIRTPLAACLQQDAYFAQFAFRASPSNSRILI